MKLKDFKLESYLAKYEFSAPYLLCPSDCQTLSIKELLALEPASKELFLNLALGYSPAPGDPAFLNEVAGLYEAVKPDNILEHVGAQEAIFNFMNVTLDPGDHVVCMFPAYQSLFEVARSMGCEVSRWLVRSTESGWRVDIGELKALIKPNTKVIVLNSPHNPTGYTFSEGEMTAIISLARKHNITIFADEVYRGLEYHGESNPAFADRYELAVSLGVMSKAYGLAGLRLGWIATQDNEIRRKMGEFKYYTTICGSVPAQFLATLALRHRTKILERNRKIIKDNLKLAGDFFYLHQDMFFYSCPMAGPVGFHRLNLDQSIDTFCANLIKEKGLLLLPGTTFDYEGNYFRLGYGRSDFAAGLSLLEEYISGN